MAGKRSGPFGLVLLASLAVFCVLASAATDRQAESSTTDFDAPLRLEGNGVAGGKMVQLLDTMNKLAARVPRLGSEATIATADFGSDNNRQAAQRRTATVYLNNDPLYTQGAAFGGSAAVDSAPAGTALKAASTSVAKDIVDDHDLAPKNFGSTADVQGITVTKGRARLPGGSATRGAATTTAGEKALRSPTRDGSEAQAQAAQQGIGDNVSTRLETSTLSSISDGKNDGSPTQSSGSYLAAAVDSTDRPGKSTTLDFKKPSNTQVVLNAKSGTNRYGFTRADGVSGDVKSDNTDSGRAELKGGHFGTGFTFGTTAAQSTTYLDGKDKKP